jgi:hypothetical protein
MPLSTIFHAVLLVEEAAENHCPVANSLTSFGK